MNYKDAYYHLFNEVSTLIEQLKRIQIESEELCIGETKLESLLKEARKTEK